MRLHCRAAENLLVSDEVLSKLNITWNDLVSRITEWLANNPSHPHHSAMKTFAEGDSTEQMLISKTSLMISSA